jgi:hypothetical protein
MVIYLYAGIIAKIVQNGEENGQGRQVDVAGRLGAHMPRRLALPWHRSVPHLPIPRHWSVGEVLQAFCLALILSHDGVILDPWFHYHRLGALQPTLELPYWPNLCTCFLHNSLWEPTKALRSKGGAIQHRSAPLPRRSTPKLPPPPYLMSISTPLQQPTLESYK